MIWILGRILAFCLIVLNHVYGEGRVTMLDKSGTEFNCARLFASKLSGGGQSMG